MLATAVSTFGSVPTTVTEVWVDDDYCDGCANDGHIWGYDAFATIQDGIDAVTGSTVHVAAGTYNEEAVLTPGNDVVIAGEGREVVTWKAPSGGICLTGSLSGYTGSMDYEIYGITFNCRSDAAATWGAGIQINSATSGPLNLRIHDCRFIEDRASGDDTHWGTSMLLCHNRHATRDISGDGAVRVFNNVDETWGGMTISNSRAYDIYNNVFDGCSNAIYNGHGCPDVAGQTFGDHHIYGNVFKNASDSLHPGALTPAIDWQYYGAGGGIHLASVIEENIFQGNDTTIRFVLDTDMTYPAHMVRYNNFLSNGSCMIVTGAYASAINAEDNWWGHTSGPYDPDGSAETDGLTCYDPSTMSNADGLGDPVGDATVDYCPWLTTPAGDNILALMVEDASLYIKPSENAVIDMDVYNLIQKVLGCQAIMNYDSTYFGTGPTDVDVQPGGAPWDEVIYEAWDVAGDLDIAVGVEVNVHGPTSGTDADGTVAILTLTPTGVEGVTNMIFRPDVDDIESTWLADMNSLPVVPTKLDSLDIVIDGTDPVVTNLAATQDQGTGAIDVLDCANTTLQGTVSLTVDAEDALAGLEGVPSIDVRHSDGTTTLAAVLLDGEGPAFGWQVTVGSGTKNGTYTITIMATDKAGNDADIAGTLCVNKNQITGSIELDSLDPPAGGITRTVTFVATGGVQKTWNLDLGFGEGVNAAAYTLMDVPEGSTALSAKTDWNLREKLAVTLTDGQGTADFIGDGVSGWDDGTDHYLRGGDLNNSNTTNILDFGILRTHWYTSNAEADINGDGEVNLGDFNILRINWFQRGDSQ